MYLKRDLIGFYEPHKGKGIEYNVKLNSSIGVAAVYEEDTVVVTGKSANRGLN